MPPPSLSSTSSRFRRVVELIAISAVLCFLPMTVAPPPADAQVQNQTVGSRPIAGRFATAEDFVAQGYRDVFGREPDGPGLAYWSDLIRNGARPSEVLFHFIGSPEFAGRIAPVTRLHLAIFGRVPTAAELRAGIRGLPTEQQAAALVQSSEFGLGGDLTAAVTRILDNTGEPGDPVQQAARIRAGRITLAEFAVARSESPGHVSRTGPTVAASTVYLGLLRRAPEPAGLAYWSREIRRALALEGFIAAVLDGREYRGRFPEPARLTTTVVASGLDIPWDVAPLPDGRLLVTERAGRLVLIDSGGASRTVTADLSDLFAGGETGLMGLALDPGFDTNRRFYTCQGHRSPQEIQVVAWTLDVNAASAVRVADPLAAGLPLAGGRHGGCQLEVDQTGALIVGTGDAATGTLPQNLASLGGKILRVDPRTGGPAPGNPFAGSANLPHPARLQLRPPQRPRAVDPPRYGRNLECRTRSGHRRRGQPDRGRRQLRLEPGAGLQRGGPHDRPGGVPRCRHRRLPNRTTDPGVVRRGVPRSSTVGNPPGRHGRGLAEEPVAPAPLLHG